MNLNDKSLALATRHILLSMTNLKKKKENYHNEKAFLNETFCMRLMPPGHLNWQTKQVAKVAGPRWVLLTDFEELDCSATWKRRFVRFVKFDRHFPCWRVKPTLQASDDMYLQSVSTPRRTDNREIYDNERVVYPVTAEKNESIRIIIHVTQYFLSRKFWCLKHLGNLNHTPARRRVSSFANIFLEKNYLMSYRNLRVRCGANFSERKAHSSSWLCP